MDRRPSNIVRNVEVKRLTRKKATLVDYHCYSAEVSDFTCSRSKLSVFWPHRRSHKFSAIISERVLLLLLFSPSKICACLLVVPACICQHIFLVYIFFITVGLLAARHNWTFILLFFFCAAFNQLCRHAEISLRSVRTCSSLVDNLAEIVAVRVSLLQSRRQLLNAPLFLQPLAILFTTFAYNIFFYFLLLLSLFLLLFVLCWLCLSLPAPAWHDRQ